MNKANNDTNKNVWLKLLQWLCPPHLIEEIEGDLLQKFNRDAKAFGERKAKRRLLLNVHSISVGLPFCRLLCLESRTHESCGCD